MTTQEFHDMVVEAMEVRGWNRQDLANASGIAYSTINNMLQEKREPKLETFSKIIDCLEIEYPGPQKNRKSKDRLILERTIDNLSDTQLQIIDAYAKGLKKGYEMRELQ